MSEKSAAIEKTPQSIFSLIDTADFKQKLAKALPETLKVERVVQLAYTLLKKDSTLAQCTPLSIMASIADASALGLEIDKILGHAYLVPFKGECVLIVGYRGFAELMYRTGTISSISAEVVRNHDKFGLSLGTKRHLMHVPQPSPAKDGPDNWRGAYAAVQFLTGLTDFEYLDKAHIELARSRSNSWRSFQRDGRETPWNTDPEEMWRKTPIRRLAKRMPNSVTDKRKDLLRAVMLDEYSEKRGLLTPTLGGWEVNPDPPPEPEVIAPTLEAQLQESIEDVEERKKQVAGKNKKIAPKPSADVPKAAVPPASKIDDSFITPKQQTELYNAALQAGWRVPEEITEFIKKRFKVNSIREVRASMFAELLAKAKGNTR
jgi:recombination protein RecT